MRVGDTITVKLPGPTRNSSYDHEVRLIHENDLGVFFGTAKSFGVEMIVEFWQSSSTINTGIWVGEVDELHNILSLIKEAP